MTLTTTEFVVFHDGDGVTTVFPYNKPFDEAEDLRALILRADNTQFKPTYTASGQGGGGSVQITSAPPAVGEKLMLFRETSLLQKTNYSSGDFPSEAHEALADRLMMAAQERAAVSDRTLRFSEFSDGFAALPPIEEGRTLVRTAEGFGPGPTGDEVALAQAYASAALGYRDAAGNSATAANQYSTSAQRWAAEAEGSEVSGGLFSAFHYALLSQKWAAAGADVEILPGLFSAMHYAAKAAQSALDATASIPAGTLLPVANATVPTGFLKANGAILSRATFAPLFAAIGETYGAGDGATTFQLPDLRGEFFRGWDDGRGVDPLRALGSFQDWLNGAHTHTVDPPSTATSSGGSHTHSYSRRRSGTKSFSSGNSGFALSTTETKTTGSGGTHSHTLDIPAFESAASGGSEARPRNIALMMIIKY